MSTAAAAKDDDAFAALDGTEADIHLAGVTKRFGEMTAVDDLTLSIERGAFYALLGPSGCGKTTTLRMIGGFEDPSAGTIYLGGEEVTDHPPYRRDVNTVFQSYALFPHLSVEKNVAFGLERKKVGRSEIRRRVTEIMEIVSLTGMEKRAPREMSGGQQQRVALARALVNRPRALLLDEPLGALDLKLRQQMQVELKRIQREVGITFVYVTHDQGEALTMSDRIAVMQAGVIEQLGSPRQIYERPATRFVAGFIGTSNLISGRADGVDGNRAVISYGDEGRVIVPMSRPVTQGDAIEVSVRPEKIDLHRGGPPATDGSLLAGMVTEVVYHGTSTNYTVATAAGPEFVVFDQNTTTADDLAERGDRVFLTWAPQHSYPIGA
jgi:spermidine/putrescine transport system ATP-binding protein